MRDLVTQTKGLAYWEPSRTNPKARKKIGTRGRGKGRTYIAHLYHACQKLGVRILANGTFKVHPVNGDIEGRLDVLAIGPEAGNERATLEDQKEDLKEYTKEAVKFIDGKEVVEKIATRQFLHEGAHASGSRKWLRTACLNMPEYKTMVAAAFNVLPVKSVVSTWKREGGRIGVANCSNCAEGKRETVKHLFCSCKHPLYEAIRTKRHDKIVCELYCWVKLNAEKGRLGHVNQFQMWMADNTWGLPRDNTMIFPEILGNEGITHRRPDLIFQYQPKVHRRGGEEAPRSPHQIEI